MIISHKHKFIFVKTQKTAGSSLEIALSAICGAEDVLTPLDEDEEKVRKALGYRGAQNYIIPFWQYKTLDWAKFFYFRKRLQYYHHMSAHQIKWYLGADIWKSYFTFCFERNPWDKVISYYYWEEGDRREKNIQDFLLSGRGGDMRGFDLYSQGGVPIVDKVYKYENMEDNLKDLSDRLGLCTALRLPEYRAKGGARKDKRSYREILSAQEAELIAAIFAREIKYFSYYF
ncbi:sulfotransferase family protein [Cesiribacter andamanensis]|uniref:Sulfotransferase family protein n=1 Tax=Cesiribacter andamanensis AMV16 TaxID=1279009 RepID=M7N8N1_9BACT|nr:sulfotransferase family 2 domain-containing protein [Cesiribacter andamanensis]EMR03571.1 hypothetical protein ADICEAN_01252 [Cesiribacter andamanensis AMV16]